MLIVARRGAARLAPEAVAATLCLPQTAFPMRAEAPVREPAIQRACLAAAYDTLSRRTTAATPYVLHDGPPFANGPLHLGHMLNKTLKDMAVRFQALQGRPVSFVPGWDCHGLPIEAKALAAQQQQRHQEASHEVTTAQQPAGVQGAKRTKGTKDTKAAKRAKTADQAAPVAIVAPPPATDAQATRSLCRSFAEAAVARQRAGFERLGVLADWNAPYLTMAPAYEAAQLRVFGALVARGLVQRQYKPVYWSPSSRTALAEAEIEYDTHTSPSAYVTFALAGLPETAAVRAAVWTTTPWTLPANQALAVNREMRYALCHAPGMDTDGMLLVACARRDALAAAMNVELKTVRELDGAALVGLTATHPLDPTKCDCPKPRRVVHATHVTDTAGTGVVHMAPAHGQEDHAACAAAGIVLAHEYDLLDDSGCFRPAAGERLAGQEAFGAGNATVLQLLTEAGALLHQEPYHHRYPFDWRTRKPIMLRATKQWFASVTSLRGAALNSLGSIEMIPAHGRARLRAMIEDRKEWCISRQRVWGVPLPVFYDEETDEALLTEATVAHVANVVEQHGTDAWWTLPLEDLLPAHLRPAGRSFRRGTDTLDVWFDSGTSWSGVIAAQHGPDAVADIYLEGSDQHRGWFQSSLLTRAATSAGPPCRQIVTHGFVLDEHGRKMSKSLGNGVDPLAIIEGDGTKKNPGLGADVLRFWVASTDYTGDVLFGKPMLDTAVTNLRKLRNTGRFLLGNLSDFDPAQDIVAMEDLPELDRYMLHVVHGFAADTAASYDALAFQRVTHALNQLAVNDLSGFYFEVVKDRLYLEHRTGRARRSAQTVLYHLLLQLQRAVLPIACHLGEELHHFAHGVDPAAAAPGTLDSAMLQAPSVAAAAWVQPALAARWAALRSLRTSIFRAIHLARGAGMMQTSAPAAVTLEVSDSVTREWLQTALEPDEHGDTLLNKLCLTAEVTLAPISGLAENSGIVLDTELKAPQAPTAVATRVHIKLAEKHKCVRCWRHVATESEGICRRCSEVLVDDGHIAAAN